MQEDTTPPMYRSLLLPWSTHPSAREAAYGAQGLLRTHGTIFTAPPPDQVLRESFNAPPRPKSRMSSGAIALCKHFERGGGSSEHGRPHPFWTLPRGSNEAKTAMAAEALERMLGEAVWRNVMLLHAGVAVYEIRNPRGWGMLWTLEVEARRRRGRGHRGDIGGGERERDGDDDAVRDWVIRKTAFRGFVEPIEEMDHEIP
ncbi:Uu.00g146960.m01.CDS01 [Anthostomella pinea]|uniref:Uu.00g146960.m01.CDS01 n=1 Tax=Anthostomella pinea TaxID=933095 RepID=A0AAI8VKU0_9PEZI|nr:Uu.00g146960.m01.CDS01 [Anthostomella pinea]